MRFLFELSGEHPTLPAAEAAAVLSLSGPVLTMEVEPGLLVAEASETARRYFSRIALSHSISEWLFGCEASEEQILLGIRSASPRVATRFAIRASRIAGSARPVSTHALERKGGEILSPMRVVDLERPETEIRILLGLRAHAGAVLCRVDRSQYEDRHVRNRPFFRPVSLHPRIARTLVNLARVEPGGKILDPFCGTGGIAIEAALVGARVVASDADPRMVEGTAKALSAVGASCDLRVRDVGEVAGAGPFDAIVTDPPYGRSASRRGEAREALYVRAVEAFAAALSPQGRLVIAFPEASDVELLRSRFAVEEIHLVRVHASLTRHIVVATRSGA